MKGLEPLVTALTLKFKNNSYKANLTLLGIPFLGILLRLFHYFDNRSLWRDEAYLALNLINRDFNELTNFPLDYNQHAPIGFLFIEKLIGELFSYDEQSLRLLPLLSGIIALLIFVSLSKQILNKTGIYVAITLMAFAHPVIYQSVEVKQYSTEMLLSVIMIKYWVNFKSNTSKRNEWLVVLAGSIGLWFSYSLIFILSGLLTAILADAILNKKFILLRLGILSLLCWGISFGIHYHFFIFKSYSPAITTFWQAFFPCFPPSHFSDLVWFPKMAFYVLDDPLGINLQILPTVNKLIRFSFLGVFLILMGCFAYFKTNKVILISFLTPLAFVIIAATLHKYVPYQRLLLFYAPIVFLIIGKSTDYICFKYKKAGTVIAFLFLMSPVLNTLQQLCYPEYFGGFRRNDFNKAFKHIPNKPLTKVFVDGNVSSLFLYYSKIYSFSGKYTEITFNNLENTSIKSGCFLILNTPTSWLYYDPVLKDLMQKQNNDIEKAALSKKLNKTFQGLNVSVYKAP